MKSKFIIIYAEITKKRNFFLLSKVIDFYY